MFQQLETGRRKMSEVLVCLPCALSYEKDSGYKNCPRCKKPLTRAKKIRRKIKTVLVRD